MAARRMPAAEVRRRLDRLSALSLDRAQQVRYALELLGGQPSPEIVLAATAAVTRGAEYADHDALVAAYDSIEAAGNPGSPGRTAILKALRGRALPGDVPLLERALTTYATSPMVTGYTNLRAAALLVLDDIDPALANAHAVRLLAEGCSVAEQREQSMSGEPALTAARLLAAKDEALPLFFLALSADTDPEFGDPVPATEVVAEAIRGLAVLPASTIGSVLERHAGTADAVLLAGLADMVIGHTPDDGLTAALSELLGDMPIDAYRYVVAAIVASRRSDLIALLLAAAREEFNRERLAALVASLALIPGGGAAAVRRDIETRLAARGGTARRRP